MSRHDVALVGAGPIGIEMAVALKRAGVDYVHFEAGQIGATVQWFAPQTRFFSSNERIAIAGVPLVTADQSKATREDYLAYLRAVVMQFDLSIRTFERVMRIERQADELFELTTERRGEPRRYIARRVILATGGTDRPRKLGIPGEDLPHVSSYFRDPHTYFRQSLLIIGGRNSAAEAALRCHHAGARVAISYRRPSLPEQSIKYWLWPELKGLLDAGRIVGHFATVPVKITPTHARLRRLVDGSEFDVEADFVLSLIGYEQDNTLLKQAGIELVGEQLAPRFDERTMQTNVPGVYVIGTATAGTQHGYRVFIENCHVQVDRVMADLLERNGDALPEPVYDRPES
jgi:thioredoxin reductase (NADPH)